MAGKLFGIAVPANAAQVVIRPIIGPGNSSAMYAGPIPEGLAPDTEIMMTVAESATFWKYVDAKKVKQPEDGEYKWRLRIQFIHQGGVEGELVTTDEFHPFIRTVAAAGAGAGAPEDAASRIIAGALLAAKEIISTAGLSAAQLMAAGSAPTVAAIQAMVDTRKDDVLWREEAMKALMALMRQGGAVAQPNALGGFKDLLQVGTLFAGLAGLKKDKPN